MSQCLSDDGRVSLVTLYCGYDQLIDVSRAVHGQRAASLTGTDHCSQLDVDCVIDVTPDYDWSQCRGRHHCVQTVQLLNDTRHRHVCSHQQHTTLTYLQVSHSILSVFSSTLAQAPCSFCKLENAWQSLAYSPLGAVVSPPSEYL